MRTPAIYKMTDARRRGFRVTQCPAPPQSRAGRNGRQWQEELHRQIAGNA
ncbi:MAG: hypothetical protein OD918_09455 [Gammaproteobacteria bacterium]